MSKDCFPKLKGSICNIPIHAIEINNIQPHGTDSNGLGTVRFKKWAYLGSLFEAVRPKSINQAMLYFKKYNPLRQGITINMNNIPDNTAMEQFSWAFWFEGKC